MGDFDSYNGSLPDNIPRLDLPVEKDDTDTLAAIRHAISEGYKEITLYCACGGRLDHLTANIQSAAYAAANGAVVRITDSNNEITVLKNTKIIVPQKTDIRFRSFRLPINAPALPKRGLNIRLIMRL